MTDLTVAEVFDRAADLIEPEGAWTQGAFSRNADGSADADEYETSATNPVCWCTLGALAEVCGADTTELSTFTSTNPQSQAVAASTLRSHLRMPVEEWNDAPGRTQAEVVAKLREAAQLARTTGVPEEGR